MSAKPCDHHGSKRKKLLRRLFGAFLIFIIVVLFIILLVWLILRPTKPRFTLQDATVYQFNVSSPNFLSSNLQVTIASRNPNDKIGIYYDRLDVYASYRNQQITLPTALPPTYQGHKDINVWSPFVYGNSIPIAPFLAVSLNQEQTAGMVLIYIKVDGRVRWKVGTWISGKYHIYVNCPAYLTFGSRFSGVPVGPALKFQIDRECHTDV
ncbi:Late embryogenesis abundant protein [Macleaya cordata]|uniref:Late embryogenesis abundant protein n=1 Tax=Macleaya cordata TaxID=56857 RepID=A0A200Q9G7_MACCD|nr:Late embryogenesis abundant protein [Macleaya cordata]